MKKAFRRHVAAFIDWYAWGYRDKYNADWEVNPRHILNAYFAKEEGVFPQKLTFRLIEDYHLSDKYLRQGTLYCRSRYYADYAALMVDLDDKDRTAQDTEDAWGYLRDRYFPGAYGEPSTSGTGTHGYVIVSRHGVEPDAFLELAYRLEAAIEHAASVWAFRCQFDQLCGIPNRHVNGQITEFSQLAKIPRLTTPEKVEAYLQARVFSCEEIDSIIGKMMNCRPSEDVAYLERLWNNQPNPHEAEESPLSEYITGNRVPSGGGKEPLAGQIRAENLSVYEDITGNSVPQGRYMGSPAQRMSRSAWDLAVKLKRVPSTDELLGQYESLGLHTGFDHDGNRQRLAEENHAWLAENFDVTRLEGFTVAKYLPLIRTHVSQQIRDEIRQGNRSHYTDEQVAVVLYTVEKAAFGNNGRLAPFVCSNGQIEGMFDALGMQVPNRKQLAAMKDALVRAGLVLVVDAHHHPGKAKKLGLGPNHPLHLHQADLPNGIVPEKTLGESLLLA